MKDYLSTQDISKICSVVIQTVVNWVQSEKLKCFTTAGGHRRIRREDFEEFILKYNIPVSKQYLNKKENFSVLIAEDEQAVAELIRMSIADIEPDWDIRIANDGVEALIRMGELKPDAVILDIIMPNMDGIEVCKKLRAGCLGYIPVIISITAKVLKKDEKDYLHNNTDAFLKKPVDAYTIIRTLKKAVRDREKKVS